MFFPHLKSLAFIEFSIPDLLDYLDSLYNGVGDGARRREEKEENKGERAVNALISYNTSRLFSLIDQPSFGHWRSLARVKSSRPMMFLSTWRRRSLLLPSSDGSSSGGDVGGKSKNRWTNKRPWKAFTLAFCVGRFPSIASRGKRRYVPVRKERQISYYYGDDCCSYTDYHSITIRDYPSTDLKFSIDREKIKDQVNKA